MRFQAPLYAAAVGLGARADAVLARSIAAKRQHDQVHSAPLVRPQHRLPWRGAGPPGWLRRARRHFRLAERANFNTNPANRDFGRVSQQQGAGRTLQFTARLEF